MRSLLLSLVVTILPTIATAHHSTAANFTQEIISVAGTIEQVRFQNPHSSVLIKNTDAEGNDTFWLLETVSRTTLSREGVSMDTLEIGSQVTATGRKGRRDFTLYIRDITFQDGTVFNPEP